MDRADDFTSPSQSKLTTSRRLKLTTPTNVV